VSKSKFFMNIFKSRKIFILLASILIFIVFASGVYSLEKSQISAKKIIDLKVSQEDDLVRITLIGDGDISKYRCFQLINPQRLSIDLPGISNKLPKRLFEINKKKLKQIRVGEYSDKVRIVFDFSGAKSPSFKLEEGKNSLIVIFDGFSTEKKELKEEAKKVLRIDGIELKEIEDKFRIMVAASGQLKYDIFQPSENQVVLKFEETELLKDFNSNLDIAKFNSAIESIEVKQTEVNSSKYAEISIKLKEAVSYLVSQEGNLTYLDFDLPKTKPPAKSESVVKASGTTIAKVAPSDTPEKAEEVKTKPPAKSESVAKASGTTIAKVAPSDTPEKAEEVKTKPSLKKKAGKKPVAVPGTRKKTPRKKMVFNAENMTNIYRGRKVSLDFHKADIHNVFRVISEICGKNLVIGGGVKGKITIKLVDVPWDQALDIILESKKLGKMEIGNVIRIASREDIEDEIKRKKDKIIAARKERAILALLVTEIVPVNYAEAGELTGQIEKLLTPDRGSISTDERTNSLIIRDVATNIAKIKNFLKQLDTPTPQVLIEARIVQFNPSYTKDIGIRWDANYDTESSVDRKVVVDSEGNVTQVRSKDYQYGVSSGAGGLASGAIGQMAFGFISNSIDLDIELNALERDGKVKIISRPRIMTLDNKTAKVEQGVDIPYLKLSEQGVTSTEFKKATLSLEVTPHITPDGSVIMEIIVKKDQPGIETSQGLGIDTKLAETEVLVKSGASVVIGGIIEENETETVERVPYFSKIPGLGIFFQKKKKETVKTDLTIFIMPRIAEEF